MRKKITLSIVLCTAILMLSIMMGSVSLSVHEIFEILGYKLFARPLDPSVSLNHVSIFYSIRLPRALVAFCVGGMLSVSGCILQAILHNPLASSYTLGVSSGASLGACIVIVFSFGIISLPIVAFVFGLMTVFVAMALAQRFDRSMHPHTIILVGMILSLFVNSILTLLTSLHSTKMQQLYFWTMGSFSGRGWGHLQILVPIALIGLLLISRVTKELDILSFGDRQALSMGVSVPFTKRISIFVATLLTAVAVCFSGTIGFVDLVTPHIVRKVFGPQHKIDVWMCFCIGGAFMALSDMVARTILAPIEIPVGAITALIGAPFFTYIYFVKK